MGDIKFLHLTDLHLGDKCQKGLFSQAKKVIFEDIEYLLQKMGGIDVVFFSGDFVQKGTKEEFELFEAFLQDLWALFKKSDQNPLLFHVPGNHDVERISDKNNPTQKIMLNWVKEDIKNDYFWTSPNLYHDFIQERFLNYSEWAASTSIPNVIEKKGFIAGDFYSSVKVGDIQLGVIGLNSTFLQLEGGDFRKKLGIYNQQMSYMFGEHYFEWLQNQNLVILMTHQAPDWYEDAAANDYLKEIYAQGCFAEHLCGHMHEPTFESSSVNGFPARHIFLSPSLFGLEYFGDTGKVDRIHGYTGGIYHVNDNSVAKTIWPRISVNTKSGLKITQNEEFNLDKDSASLTVRLKDRNDGIGVSSANGVAVLETKAKDLFSSATRVDKGLNRKFYREYPSHTAIRKVEQAFCCNSLTKNKICWVTAGVALAYEEFIGSILKDAHIHPNNCFSIDCDDVTTIDELTEKFLSTFSKNITEFIDIVSTLQDPLLVLKNFKQVLAENPNILYEFLKVIFDFSPNLKILIISEGNPGSELFPNIQLIPLDIHSVMQYMEAIQEIQIDFSFLEYEKIHRISSGIPHYLDEVAKQLEFRPLSDLGDLEFKQPNSNTNNSGISKAMINEIHAIKTHTDKQSSRRFLMLCVLSLLHNGETFDRIKRFEASTPFYPDDIKYLLDNKMAETIRVNSIFDNSNKDSEVLRIIKIPRIIRDYITELIPIEEKVLIYKKICGIYLGPDWRQFIKLIQPKDAELQLIVHQNLQIALRFLLSYSIEIQSEIESTRLTRISIELTDYFSDRGAYKEAIFLAEEILKLITDLGFTDLQSSRLALTKMLGENLRMSSNGDKGLNILREICDDDSNSLTKDERNEIRGTLALGYKGKDKGMALQYAELVKKNEKDRDSVDYLSAESIILFYIEDPAERIRKLSALKNKAEKHGYNILSANIILELNNNKSTDQSQLKSIDKIIERSKGDTYTKVRALLAKAEIVLNSKNVNDITDGDLLGLNIAYSYSFYQRLSVLVSKCHILAWDYWTEKRGYEQLLNIFRYSSFVWRLCGENDIEVAYLNTLRNNEGFNEWFLTTQNSINGSYYEQRAIALAQ